MAASQGSDLQGSGAPGSVKKPSCIKSPYYVIATLTPSAFGLRRCVFIISSSCCSILLVLDGRARAYLAQSQSQGFSVLFRAFS